MLFDGTHAIVRIAKTPLRLEQSIKLILWGLIKT